MTPLQVDGTQIQENFKKFVEEGILQNLKLDSATDDLRLFIEQTVQEKAQSVLLWVNLMLGVLKLQATEEDMRRIRMEAPTGIHAMIRETLKAYNCTFETTEAQKVNTILAWLSCAVRSLTLAELHAGLQCQYRFPDGVASLEGGYATDKRHSLSYPETMISPQSRFCLVSSPENWSLSLGQRQSGSLTHRLQNALDETMVSLREEKRPSRLLLSARTQERPY
jgi:hypothetical protein